MEEKYESLEKIFKKPPNEFRMMPFWFWNHEMVEKEVIRQIQDHHEHGIGGEFAHPRHGRLTPYMGRRWLENIEAAADKCKELGMPLFLYDEDNWPSGPAGGYITGPYRPENRGKFLALFDEETFKGPDKVVYELDYQDISEETVFHAAIAVPEPDEYPDFSKVISRWKDVSANVKDGVFTWEVPDGEWLVLFFCMLVNPADAGLNGYIDILREDTVKDFINFTHVKYVEYFKEKGKGSYIGTVVPGIFTDEPSMAHFQVRNAAMLPWITFTPEMPGKFKKMFGYEFNEALISLFHDTGPVSAKHRCNYWKCATEMYVNAFYKQIYDYCDKNNLRFTGHINSEGVFPSHVKNHGDFFKVFEYMHYGGVDQLTEEVRPDNIEDLWNLDINPYTGMARDMILASKLASSAAHLLKKPRVLVEAFGTSSWDITMASAKRVNDYLILTGCDLFVPHSFNISEDGYRKGDHPPAFNYQPYYKHWKKLCDHNARLCAVLNAHSGTLIPPVLYYYPSKSFHAEMLPHDTEIAERLGDYFTHAADCLFRQQLDFELANEDMIISGSLSGSRININGTSFNMLVLGVSTCVGIEFARFVKKYYDQGGKIIASLLLPFKEENTGESEEIASIFKHIFGVDPVEISRQHASGSIKNFEIVENKNASGGHAIFIKGPNIAPYRGRYYPVFEEACERVLPSSERDVVAWKDREETRHPAYVMIEHKSIGDKEFYFMANTSKSVSYEDVSVILDVIPKRVELWDTLSGEIHEFKDHGFKDGKMVLRLEFPIYRSYLFAVVPMEECEPPADKVPTLFTFNQGDPEKIIDLGKDWQCILNDPNGAMLYKKWQSSYNVEAGRAWGYRSTRTFTHEFMVEDPEQIVPIKLVIEGLVGDYGWCKTTLDHPIGGDRAHFTFPNSVQIYVNGSHVNVNFNFDRIYLDAYWVVLDISRYIVAGKNEVKMVCSTGNHGTFHVVTDPWRLIGNFECDEQDGIPLLKKPRDHVELGDYTKQGFSRYHGGFSYVKEFDIPESFSGKKAVLNIENTRDCIEVRVNGQFHDVLWHEWQTDVTGLIRPGEKNKIELVYHGIAQNMLQTNIKPQGIQGKVTIRFYS
ncbi:MAG: glycosyl hydrolase [Promethearchaeota archaeon]